MYVPAILERTSEGVHRYAIQDAMLQRREIECLGEITPEAVNGLILQLRYLQQEDPEAEITLYINSPGGEVASGLALYDVIAALRCPLRTVCVGTAASMAALIFAVGKRREMLPHARLMIHDPLIAGGIGGSALHIDSVSRDLMRTRQTMAELLAKHSGHTLEEVYEKTAKDTYFDAEEAVAWGLADRVTHEI